MNVTQNTLQSPAGEDTILLNISETGRYKRYLLGVLTMLTNLPSSFEGGGGGMLHHVRHSARFAPPPMGWSIKSCDLTYIVYVCRTL